MYLYSLYLTIPLLTWINTKEWIYCWYHFHCLYSGLMFLHSLAAFASSVIVIRCWWGIEIVLGVGRKLVPVLAADLMGHGFLYVTVVFSEHHSHVRNCPLIYIWCTQHFGGWPILCVLMNGYHYIGSDYHTRLVLNGFQVQFWPLPLILKVKLQWWKSVSIIATNHLNIGVESTPEILVMLKRPQTMDT